MAASQGADGGRFCFKAILVISLMVTMTMTVISTKSLQGVQATGVSHVPEQFGKPTLNTIAMNVAMMVYLPVWALRNLCCASKPAVDQEGHGSRNWLFVYIVAMAFLETSAVLIYMTGSLRLMTSTYSVMRGSQLVWSMLLSTLFLGKTSTCLQKLGIVFIIVGMILGGVSDSFLAGTGAGNENMTDQLVGSILVIAGMGFKAGNAVLMVRVTSNYNVNFSFILGCVGFLGLLQVTTLAIPILHALPGNDNGSVENIEDALWKVSDKPQPLLSFYSMLIASAFIYTGSLYAIAINISPVASAVVESLRSGIMWILGLLCFHAFGLTDNQLAEPWNSGSPMKLTGILLLVAGVFLYAQILTIRCQPGGAASGGIDGTANDGSAPVELSWAPVSSFMSAWSELSEPEARRRRASISSLSEMYIDL